MSKKRKTTHPAAKRSRRGFPAWLLVVAALAIVTAGALWDQSRRARLAQLFAPSPGAADTTAPAAAARPSDFQVLKGRWQRTDGGYVVDIKYVAESGAIEAGYYNPRPINVARAEATRDGSALKVFIELRDVNYPGSTYTLIHDPATDRLRGVYFQAVQQQSFDVTFVRLN